MVKDSTKVSTRHAVQSGRGLWSGILGQTGCSEGGLPLRTAGTEQTAGCYVNRRLTDTSGETHAPHGFVEALPGNCERARRGGNVAPMVIECSFRSEERRVGKECRSRWSTDQ